MWFSSFWARRSRSGAWGAPNEPIEACHLSRGVQSFISKRTSVAWLLVDPPAGWGNGHNRSGNDLPLPSQSHCIVDRRVIDGLTSLSDLGVDVIRRIAWSEVTDPHRDQQPSRGKSTMVMWRTDKALRVSI